MKSFSLATAFCLLVMLIGCTSSQQTQTPPKDDGLEDHHPHDIESLDACVKELSGYRDEIKAAFDAGKPNDCDHALHESIHVLNAIPDSEPYSNLSAESKESVKAAIAELAEALQSIHDGAHGGGGIADDAYSSVADKIQGALDKITQAVAPQA